MKTTAALTLSLPLDLIVRLKAESAADGRSLSNYVVHRLTTGSPGGSKAPKKESEKARTDATLTDIINNGFNQIDPDVLSVHSANGMRAEAGKPPLQSPVDPQKVVI